MAGLKSSNKGLGGQKGLSGSQMNLNNTRVEDDSRRDLQSQIANTEADTQALLSELSLYTSVLQDPLKTSDPSLNAVQKILNLKENQGVFSSMLTLMNRPAEALQGAVVAAMNPQSGGNIVGNAFKGITGREEYNFQDLGIPLGDNPWINGLAGMAFEVFIDPIDFVNQPFKLLYTKGKDVFKATKNKAEIFFSKTDTGTAAYSEFSDVMNRFGTLIKKNFNLWKDVGFNKATNSLSNLNNKLTRGKEEGAGLIVNLLETAAALPKQIVGEWDKYIPEELTQIREALGFKENWVPSTEAKALVAKNVDNPEGYNKDFKEASPEVREEMTALNNATSQYLSKIKEAEYPHGQNISDVLADLSTSKFKASTQTSTTGEIKHFRTDAFTDAAAKTVKQFESSDAFLFIKNILEKSIGAKLVNRIPQTVDEIAQDSLIQIQKGVARFQYDNINQMQEVATGGYLTNFSEQGYQMWLTDLGKAKVSQYLRNAQNAQLSKTITRDMVGQESKYLIDLINKGEILFDPAYHGAVENMVKPLQVLYKNATGKDLSFVTSTDVGQLSMKIAPDPAYSIKFVPEVYNDKALDKYADIIENKLNKQVKDVAILKNRELILKKDIADLKTYDDAINVFFQDPVIMGMIFEDLQKLGLDKKFKALDENVEFISFVNKAESGLQKNAPFAPSDISVKYINSQINNIKTEWKVIEKDGITYNWDKLEKGVSESSMSMTMPHTTLNPTQKRNYVAYLRDRGIITDEMMQIAGIEQWSDMMNVEKMNAAFEAGYFPESLSVKISGLTKNLDTSNSYINLAQWTKVGDTPLKKLSKKSFVDQVQNINKDILSGKLLSEENIQGMFDYFSINKTRESLLYSLNRIGDEQTKLLIRDRGIQKQKTAQSQKDFTKSTNSVVDKNIESKIKNSYKGNAISRGDMDAGTSLIKKVSTDVEKVGTYTYVTEKIQEIANRESTINELSKAQGRNKKIDVPTEKLKLKEVSPELHKLVESSRFTRNGKYTSTAIVEELESGFSSYVGVQRLKNGSWEYITADDILRFKKMYTPKQMEKVMTFKSKTAENIFQKITLTELKHASFNKRIDAETNALADAMAESIYALNPQSGGLDLEQIRYLKKQNYAKSANAMLNEVSIGNIDFAIQKQTVLKKDAESKLNSWSKTKILADKTDIKIAVITKDIKDSTNLITKLESDIKKIDTEKLKAEIAADNKKIDDFTEEYNKAFEKHNAFKDKELVNAKKKYQEIKAERDKFASDVKKEKLDKVIAKEKKRIVKADKIINTIKDETTKQHLILGKESIQKNIDSLQKDYDFLLEDIKVKTKNVEKELKVYNKVKAQKNKLKEAYQTILTKREVFKNNNKIAKNQDKIKERKTKEAELKAEKANLKQKNIDLKNAGEELNIAKIDIAKAKEAKATGIKESTKDITEASIKTEEYIAVKRTADEYRKELNKAGDLPMKGQLDQLAEGMNSDIYTFYNPLSAASPQFIAKEYLTKQRHDLVMVAELLTSRKNIESIKATYNKLPELFESTVNRFVNVDQAAYGYMGRLIKEATGISPKNWEVAGYMRHMFNSDQAVMQVLKNTVNGLDSSVAGQIFGNNTKKIKMAREYQSSAFDVNEAVGTTMFNTNPVESTAFALDLMPGHFKRAATIKLLLENRLITTVDIKDYAGFNPTRTEETITTRINDLEARIARNKAKGKQNNRLGDELVKSKQDLENVREYQKLSDELDELNQDTFNAKAQKEFDAIKEVEEIKIKELKQQIKENLDKPKIVKGLEDEIALIKTKLKDSQKVIDDGKLEGEALSAATTRMERVKDGMAKLFPKVNVADTRDFISQQKWLDNNPQFQGATGEWAIMTDDSIKELESAIDLIYTVDPDSLDTSDWGKQLQTLVEDLRKGDKQNVIHKGALDMIKTLSKAPSDSGIESILQTMQKYVVKPWRTIAISSLGFHARNFLTNVVNSHLMGFNPMKVFKGAADHNKNLIKFHADLKSLEVATQSGKFRTSDEQADMIYNLMHETDDVKRNAFFEKYDAMDIAKGFPVTAESSKIFAEMMDLSSIGIVGNNQLNADVYEESLQIVNAARGKKPKFKYEANGSLKTGTDFVKKYIAMSYNWSKRIDDGFKIGTYKYINELNPSDAKDLEIIKRLSDMGFAKKIQAEDGSFKTIFREGTTDIPEIDAEAATKFVGFDYNNLSNTEHTLMKTIFPFYTWARKNVEFQMKNVLHNDKRYRQINKALKGWKRAFVEDDEQYEYQENYIPVSNIDGTVQYLKFSIPFFEADEIISGGGIINALSPIFKQPLEMITGFDFFTKREVESSQNPGFGLGLNNLYRTTEVLSDMLFKDYAPSWEDKKLAGILGKKIMDATQMVKTVFSFSSNLENDGMVNTIGSLFPSLFSQQVIANVKYQNALIKRKRAQDSLDYYKGSYGWKIL